MCKSKGGESERFRIDSVVRMACIMSPWLFLMKEVKIGMRRREVRILEDGREWRLPSLLYAGDLVLCGKSEEDLRAMVGQFAEVCRR